MTVVDAEVGAVITGEPGPDTIVHKPVPLRGALPVSNSDVTAQKDSSGPAEAGVIGPVTAILTIS